MARRKMLSGIVALLIVGLGYWGYAALGTDDGEVRYLLAAVQRGTIASSVSGSGQVSASSQIDIKPKISGDVLSIGVKNGEEVRGGTLLIQLDARDAQKAVRDAETNLESAKLQLELLRQSSADLNRIIADGFNEVATTFLDMPEIITGVYNVLFDKRIGSYENLVDYSDRGQIETIIDAAEAAYASAREAYDKNSATYHSVTRYDSQETITSLIIETSNTVTRMADAVKSTISLIDFVNDYYEVRDRSLPSAIASLLAQYKTDLTTYTSKATPHVNNLINAENFIKNAPLDIASQELVIKQRENALLDAKEDLADYSIRAPFDGVVAKVDAKRGDSVSAGSVAAVFITKQQISEISLNEVDVAKVKVGEKATLTFDAIPDLRIPGEVAEIDTVGTVSQGVVSYIVKVTFEAQDSRVKPGMTVSADIVSETKQDVLMVPNSAVKLQSGKYFAEVVPGMELSEGNRGVAQGVSLSGSPSRKEVEIGISNDDFTEIVSGVEEGEVVVVGTANSSRTSQSATRTQQQTTGFRIPGLPGGGSR